MDTFQRLQRQMLSFRRLPFVGIALTLFILAGIIYLGTMRLRQGIRGQIAGRDAAVLHSVALMEQLRQESNQELGGNLEETTDQFAVLLQISQLKGVIAARLFDARGMFSASFPSHVTEAVLSNPDLQKLRQLFPVGHFRADANPAEHFIFQAKALPATAPLLDVFIPLHRQDENRLLGVIQFVIDGESIATEFRELDRGLWQQAGIAFVSGGLLMVLGLSWAFRRLQRTSGLLLRRTQDLSAANEELALAAKTSAVGAICAHLIHGLSNPLSGLQDFVATRGSGTGESDWEDALITAGQMQRLIAEIVRIIGDEQGEDRYEVTLEDFIQSLCLRVNSVRELTGARLVTERTGQGKLPNREANLALLILENLVRNALQATPPGKIVRCRIMANASQVSFEVEDEGPGLPRQLGDSLFKPCRSTKAGGNGIGLAICRQLANHLAADLELKRSGAHGCVFALTLRVAKPAVASNGFLR